MHRLQQFTVGTILPEWEKVLVNRKLQDESELPMTALLLIESFLWLHLGLELGAFPRKVSEDVYSFYYDPFFQWLKSYSEFLESSPYLGLPEFAQILVRKGTEGGWPLDDQPSGVGERPALVVPFQSLLILYSLLCRDTAVRRFLYGIGFQSPDDWDKVWREPCPAQDLFNAVESAEATPVAMLLAGYMRFCEYGRNVNEVLDNIEGLGILDRAPLFQFKDRIRNIHAWRLDLSSRETATRFEQVKKRVSKMIDEQLSPLGFTEDVKRIQKLLESSLDLFYEFVTA